MVFDSIKDNSAFSSLILNGEASQNQWSVSWLLAYMRSVSDPHVHGEALAKVADFLLEELQHERFKEHRAGVLVTAIDVSLLCGYPILINLCSFSKLNGRRW